MPVGNADLTTYGESCRPSSDSPSTDREKRKKQTSIANKYCIWVILFLYDNGSVKGVCLKHLIIFFFPSQQIRYTGCAALAGYDHYTTVSLNIIYIIVW